MKKKLEIKPVNPTNNTYRTKDLYEASTLYALNQKFLYLEKSQDYFWFIFENKEVCQEVADKYWRREVSVDAKTYSDAVRTLKDRLFSQR